MGSLLGNLFKIRDFHGDMKADLNIYRLIQVNVLSVIDV